ncbi:MAG: 4Fe-4S binding protein [Clostridia bacterium]
MEVTKKIGFKAKINCIQPIPCNPCETACPFGAISIGEDITNLPELELEKCKGCGLCVVACPGIAITMEKITGTAFDSVTIPFEYYPTPQVGTEVKLVNTGGEIIGIGIVEKVWQPDKKDPTQLLQLQVAKALTTAVASIERSK